MAKRRNFTAFLALTALAVLVLWQFATSSSEVYSVAPREAEAIVKAAAIGQIQAAYPKGNAQKDFASLYPRTMDAQIETVAKSAKPCALLLSCESNAYGYVPALEWDIIPPVGDSSHRSDGILASLHKRWLEWRLNGALANLVRRQSPMLPEVRSQDPFLEDRCFLSADSPNNLTGNCSPPVVVGSYAFVKTEFSCGGLCGSTSLVALERRDGNWIALAVALLAQA